MVISQAEAVIFFISSTSIGSAKRQLSCWRIDALRPARRMVPMEGTDFLAQNNHQDVGILLMFLRSHNLPTAEFMIANGLTKTLGWPRKASVSRTTRHERVRLRRTSSPPKPSPRGRTLPLEREGEDPFSDLFRVHPTVPRFTAEPSVSLFDKTPVFTVARSSYLSFLDRPGSFILSCFTFLYGIKDRMCEMAFKRPRRLSSERTMYQRAKAAARMSNRQWSATA